MAITDLKLIGAKEVCEICNFSNQYLQHLVFTKKIPYVKISGKNIFLYDDIIQFKKERSEKAKKDPRIKLK